MVNIVTLMWKQVEELIHEVEDNQLHFVLDQRQNYEKFLLETNSKEAFICFLFQFLDEMNEVFSSIQLEEIVNCFIEHLSFIHIGSGVDFKKAFEEFWIMF